MSHLRRTLIAWLAVVALVAVTGCGNNNDNPSAPPNSGQMMVVHAAPDAPALDLLLDGNMLTNNLAFPNHTAYLPIAVGTHNVKAVATGTSTTVLDASVPVSAQTNYTVFANGTTPNIQSLVTTDDLSSPPTGKANVRFVHLSPDAPTVDVAVAGGAILFPNQAFRQFTAFTPVDAGTVSLEVRQAGTATVVLTVPSVTFQQGKTYTLFAKGLVAGSGAQALGVQVITNN